MRNEHKRPRRGSIVHRRKQAARPGCEVLEGRAMLAASVLDPTFGQRGVTLGPVAPSVPQAYVQVGSSSALQGDGKILVASGYTVLGSDATVGLAVERYDADGTVDPGFGVNGTAIVPVPAGFNVFTAFPDVAVGPNGSIVLAAGLAHFSPLTGTDGNGQQSLIARLTPDGNLDAGFAQGGEYLITLPGASFGHVAVQADGKIVAAGSTGTFSSNSSQNAPQITAIRLTATGVPDPSFNGTGTVDVIPAALNTHAFDTVQALALGPDGQVFIASSLTDPIAITPIVNFGDAPAAFAPNANSFTAVLSRIGADGKPDAQFGTDGSLDITNRVKGVSGLVVQADGKVVLGGQIASPPAAPPFQFAGLIRFLDDGSVDPSFRSAALDAPGSVNSNSFESSGALALGADGEFTLVGSTSTTALRGIDGRYSRPVSQLVVKRYRADGTPDARFGTGGRYAFSVSPSAVPGVATAGAAGLGSVAVAPDGQVVAAGRIEIRAVDAFGNYTASVGSQIVLARLDPTAQPPTAGDYDGDGKADVAAQLASFGVFAVRPSAGGPDRYDAFGPVRLAAPGNSGALPVAGDFDGDGKADVAAYLPDSGIFAYRPSGGGPDVLTRFGSAGVDASIPVAGDFDGDGKTDIAVYLPAYGGFAVHPSSGAANYLVPFGPAGEGASIPAVGDYDGDGKSDFAVYLRDYGQFAIRPSAGGPDVFVAFGSAGTGGSIPTPGDFDGDGQTDVAVYLPAHGSFAVHPSGGGLNYLVPLSRPSVLIGAATIPAVADYDGDGKADPAVYSMNEAQFAYRPSAGGADVLQDFGQAGPGNTLPATATYAQLPFVPRFHYNDLAQASTAPPAGEIPLTADIVAGLAGPTAARKKA